MAPELSSSEEKELIRLCVTGRLYAIEDWIRSGRHLVVSGGFYHQPLAVAMNKGFHSLVELLLRHADQSTKNEALLRAVIHDKAYIDIACAHGAEPASVPFVHVLETGDRALANFFLSRGADPLTDYPFARAISEVKAKSLLGVYLDCRRARPDWAAGLQRQADMALREFARRGDVKWVSLMIWAGADPRSPGPAVEDLAGPDDPETYSTAIEAACSTRSVAVLRALKLNAADDLDHILMMAGRWLDDATTGYLIDRGAKPNDRADGSSSLLDHALDAMNSLNKDERRRRCWASSRDLLPVLRVLLDRGAVWAPSPESTSILRLFLSRVELRRAIDVLSLFLRSPGAREPLLKIVRDARLRKHLQPQAWHLARLGLPLHDRSTTEDRAPSRYVTSRYPRETLYEEIWAEPTSVVAKRYHVSDVALSKACRQLQIPKPPRGYWARRQAGQVCAARPPLRPLPGGGASQAS